MNEQELIHAVRTHAMANYEKGGWDYVVEAWDDGDILEIISDKNATTVKQAIKAVGAEVKLHDDYRKDIQAEEF
jgi:hypothetical protein